MDNDDRSNVMRQIVQMVKKVVLGEICIGMWSATNPVPIQYRELLVLVDGNVV